MLQPSRTSSSARSQSASSAQPMPSAPCSAGKVMSSVRDLEMIAAHLRNCADLLQVLVGEDRLAHFQALGLRHAFEVEQIRPRPDDRDEAHHQLFADRVDRRVGDLREVLLEISEQRLRLVGQRRDRRVVAHGADRLLARGRHRRHQEFEVFLGVAEGLLAVEQRQIGDRRAVFGRRQVFQHDLGIGEPFLVGMAVGQRRLQFFVRDEPAFVEIDQQHLARLQPPLLDDVLLAIGSTPISEAMMMRSSLVSR